MSSIPFIGYNDHLYLNNGIFEKYLCLPSSFLNDGVTRVRWNYYFIAVTHLNFIEYAKIVKSLK